MKMWETKCSVCGKMVPANQTPQVGHQDKDGKWVNSLCKSCWLLEKVYEVDGGTHSHDRWVF